jgi:hypothetical protein
MTDTQHRDEAAGTAAVRHGAVGGVRGSGGVWKVRGGYWVRHEPRHARGTGLAGRQISVLLCGDTGSKVP